MQYLKSVLLVGICLICHACEDNSSSSITNASQPYAELHLPEQPNILWLVAEDLSCYLPSYGDSTIQTPNLSRLAAEGICFDQFFAGAPVCAPARASIATGMYPTRIAAGHMRTGGNPLYFPDGIQPYEAMPPAGTRMMSEWLRMQGYYCTNNAKEDYQFQKTVTAWDESSKSAHWRNRPANQPFFSIFNFEVTHESRIWNKADDPLLVPEDLDVPVPPYLPDNEIGRRDIRRMYSNIIELDQQVGVILDQLEADGLLDKTVIFWYSDHGGPLPRQKRLLYDSGLKVPMIIRFPNKQFANTRDDRMASFIDLAPTVLSLTGIPPKDYMDGQDFLGSYQPTEPRKYIHAAADRFDGMTDCIRAVRDTRYKYIRYYKPELPMFLHVKYRDQQPIMQELHRLRALDSLTEVQKLWFRESKPVIEFFDTRTDPHEVNSLANDLQYADKIKELSDECDRWLAAIDDVGLMPETELLEKIWPGGTQPVVAKPEVIRVENKITLSSTTDGASIGYKVLLEGSEEPEAWSVYSSPIEIQPGFKIKIIADRIGYKPSDVVIAD